MKEEEQLRQTVGRKQPFKVPDGYWDSLSGRMAESVSAYEVRMKARKSVIAKRLRVLAYAAGICGVLCMGSAYYMSRNAGKVAAVMDTEARYMYNEDRYMEEVADYAMLDNQDFYSYLSGE